MDSANRLHVLLYGQCRYGAWVVPNTESEAAITLSRLIPPCPLPPPPPPSTIIAPKRRHDAVTSRPINIRNKKQCGAPRAVALLVLSSSSTHLLYLFSFLSL
ncbi:hypothetical protein E2C01_099980 [Portunus trituberculatus]|uniref:Uncharacterized protein n=1 Tax=Portunus trituberculatus TaxID=210409 RepID=A0A5B7K1S6_PORTR|nr:hypothetical protein [Portunus trituberculatus]